MDEEKTARITSLIMFWGGLTLAVVPSIFILVSAVALFVHSGSWAMTISGAVVSLMSIALGIALMDRGIIRMGGVEFSLNRPTFSGLKASMRTFFIAIREFVKRIQANLLPSDSKANAMSGLIRKGLSTASEVAVISGKWIGTTSKQCAGNLKDRLPSKNQMAAGAKSAREASVKAGFKTSQLAKRSYSISRESVQKINQKVTSKK